MLPIPDSLTTWGSSSYTQAIAQALQFASAQNVELIVPGATSGTLPDTDNYSLLLTAAADVTLTTQGGQTLTLPLPAGYNPLRITNVSAISGATGYALY